MINNIPINNRSLGIIGGVGPLATSTLYIDIIKKFAAKNAGDIPKLLVYSLPIKASLQESFVYGKAGDATEKAIIEQLNDAVDTFKASQTSCVILPCNTLHNYFEEVITLKGMYFLNMITETLKCVQSRKYQRVGLLCSESTRLFKVYERHFCGSGIELVYPERAEQELINLCILNSSLRRDPNEILIFEKLVKSLLERMDCVVLACTDLHHLCQGKMMNLPIIDSLSVLSAASINYLCEQTVN